MALPTPIKAQSTDWHAVLAPEGVVVGQLRSSFPGTLAVYAFGSRINGGATADSDLDLAILVPGYADPLKLWDTSSQLANLLGCEVDLLDFRAASTVMQHQILTHGRRLWAEPLAAGLYECFVVSEKFKLDERRAPLLADIAREGRVYAR
jgi:uncharacterized protein